MPITTVEPPRKDVQLGGVLLSFQYTYLYVNGSSLLIGACVVTLPRISEPAPMNMGAIV